MADQEFKINIVTTSDTSGIRQTEAALSRLKGGGPVAGGWAQGLGVPIPPELLTDTAANGEKIATAMNEAGRGALFFGTNLTRARQEAIILARELTTGVPTTRTLSSLLGSLGVGIAGAAVLGIGMFKGFQESNKEVAKLIDESKTLGDELAAAAKKWQEGARAAITSADVRKIADEAVPVLDKI